MKGREGFLNCNLKVKDNKATLTIDNGDYKVLYKQNYEWTDLKKDVHFYAAENEIGTYTLMLPNEY